MSERTESLLSDNAKDLVSTVEIGFDADHRITAYRVDTLSNLGRNSNYAQFIQSDPFSRILTVYDIDTAYIRCRGVFTNTTQVTPIAGRAA